MSHGCWVPSLFPCITALSPVCYSLVAWVIMAPNLHTMQRTIMEAMINSKFEDKKKINDEEIAKLNEYTPRTVRYARSNIKRFGTIDAPPNRSGPSKKITPVMWAALENRLACEPCMTQEDMAAFLRREFNIRVSRVTVGRTLHNANWTKKVARTVAKERDPDLRDEYIYERLSYSSEHFVFVDESGSDRSIGTRKRGYAPRGIIPVQIKRFHRGKRVQILPAYTQDGVIYFEVYEGSTTTQVFDGFIERLLPYRGRFPEPRSVLVMDNASWHFSERMMRMCEAAGVIVLPQSAYSPDFSPIEEFFGELKNYIRSRVHDAWELIKADFKLFLEECVKAVGSRKKSARGHFKNALISIEEP